LDLADAIEFLGASLTTGSTFDSSVVNLHTPASKLDQALPLLADVTLRPTFPQNEIDRIRKERLAALLQGRDNPAQVAAAGFARLVYGAGHRYGTPTMGTEASNTGIAAGDLRAFYAANYQPQNAGLIVVGDITPASVLPKLEQALGAWKNAGNLSKPMLAPVAQPTARQIYLIDKPGAAQSQIRIGGVGVARMTPDYYVLDVLNTMLGGSFSSRLNQNLREEHGYTYGAGSAVHYYRNQTVTDLNNEGVGGVPADRAGVGSGVGLQGDGQLGARPTDLDGGHPRVRAHLSRRGGGVAGSDVAHHVGCDRRCRLKGRCLTRWVRSPLWCWRIIRRCGLRRSG
jgi:predicted Zn-dependent peptidase